MTTKTSTSSGNGASLFEVVDLVRKHSGAAEARWRQLIKEGADYQEVAKAWGAYEALSDLKTELILTWPL